MEKEKVSKEQINQLINEIKQLERELYLKRSRLAAYRFTERNKDDAESEALKKRFDEYIKKIGQLSTGGNSVEDIRKECGNIT